MTRIVASASNVALVTFLAIASAEANPYRLAHTFRDSDPGPQDFFGTAVAIENGVVAIKSRSGSFDGDTLSRTHLFEANSAGGWDEAASFDLIAEPNGLTFEGNPFVGDELAIDGGVVAVGYGRSFRISISDDPIQILERGPDGWSQRFASARVVPTEGPLWFQSGPLDFNELGPYSRYEVGRTLGLSGDFLIAAGSSLIDSQSVQFFQRLADNTWQQARSFRIRSEAVSFGLYAVSSAIDDDTAAVAYGSTRDLRPSLLSLYERDQDDTWSLAATLPFPNPENQEFSLPTIEIDGDLAVIRDQISNDFVLFEREGGVWREAMGPPPADQVSTFNGGGFALEGGLLARTVGGVLEDEPATVELFRRDAAGDWNLLTKIENPLPDAGLDFGFKLALDNGRLLIGARSTQTTVETLGDAFPTTPGAAFLFVPVPEPSAGGLVVMALGGGARWRGRR